MIRAYKPREPYVLLAEPKLDCDGWAASKFPWPEASILVPIVQGGEIKALFP